MHGTFKACVIALILAGVPGITFVPQASATYAITAHTVSGPIQDVDTAASTITVNGLTLLVSSKTAFRGASNLYGLTRGMQVRVRYFNRAGAKVAGSAIEIEVVQ